MDSSPVYCDIAPEKQNVPNEPLYFELEAREQSEHLGMETNPVFTGKDSSGTTGTEQHQSANPLYDLANNKLKPCNLSPNPMYRGTPKSEGQPTKDEYSHFTSGTSQEMPTTYGKLARPERNPTVRTHNDLDGTAQEYSHLKANHHGKKIADNNHHGKTKAGHTADDPETSYSTLSNTTKKC